MRNLASRALNVLSIATRSITPTSAAKMAEIVRTLLNRSCQS
jgi:hypothetical protein